MIGWLLKQAITSSHVMTFFLGVVVTIIVWFTLKAVWSSFRFYGKLLVVGIIIVAIGLLLL